MTRPVTAAVPPAPAARAPKLERKYERRGTPLCIDPRAFFEPFFIVDEPTREVATVGDVAIIDIRDALEQHAHHYWDSYEDILARVRTACASPARALLFRFDSPGGEAAGCFEAAREARAICDAAGKELHAFAEGDCCSAAYAFASVCQTITVGETSLTGSIGVVLSRDDYSAMNAANGIRVAFIASGARKADGHPDNPLTDAELASMQLLINELASVFFAHVYSTRGLALQTIAQFEARIFTAQSAVAAGLADEVGSLSTVLARLASGSKGNEAMPNPYEKARSALEEAAKGEDANANAAKAALAAMDAASGGTVPADGDEPAKDPADDGTPKPKEPGAADDAPPAKDPADDDDKKAAATAYRAAIAAQKDAAAARAEIKVMREDAERAKLVASRPGLAPEMLAILQKAPIELVRETIKDLPETPINPQLARAPLAGAAGGHGTSDTDAKRKLDERMGLVPRNPRGESTDTKLVLGGRRVQAGAATPDGSTPAKPAPAN
jgi:ClpP class serine protease